MEKATSGNAFLFSGKFIFIILISILEKRKDEVIVEAEKQDWNCLEGKKEVWYSKYV